mgnify:FL=1
MLPAPVEKQPSAWSEHRAKDNRERAKTASSPPLRSRLHERAPWPLTDLQELFKVLPEWALAAELSTSQRKRRRAQRASTLRLELLILGRMRVACTVEWARLPKACHLRPAPRTASSLRLVSLLSVPTCSVAKLTLSRAADVASPRLSCSLPTKRAALRLSTAQVSCFACPTTTFPLQVRAY